MEEQVTLSPEAQARSKVSSSNSRLANRGKSLEQAILRMLNRISFPVSIRTKFNYRCRCCYRCKQLRTRTRIVQVTAHKNFRIYSNLQINDWKASTLKKWILLTDQQPSPTHFHRKCSKTSII